MDRINATLVTGRTMQQGIALVKGKITSDYRKSTGYIELGEEAMESLALKEGENVIISSQWGEIELPCKQAELPVDVVFMPYGPLANKLIGQDTGGTGMPDSKGIMVEVRKGESNDSSD